MFDGIAKNVWLRRWLDARASGVERPRYRLHTASSVAALQLWFVVATLPVLAVAFGASSPARAAIGAAALIATAILTSLVWHVVFAAARGRRLDPGWLMHGWLFALLVPAAVPLPMAVVGMSFGVVFGSLLFGGSGRYVVSPALLGAVVLTLSYPASLGDAAIASTWTAAVASGGVTAGWWSAFVSQTHAALGSSSAAACLAGALVLVAVGAISWRIVAGGLAGAAMAAAALAPFDAALGAHWHLILGAFPFCLAFVATDPGAAAATRPGRWFYGLLFGALTVALRELNPDHPDGALAACLLAALFVPLIDQCCVGVLRRLRARRQHG